MTDLTDLYQEVILDHSNNPHNRGKPTEVSQEADGHNPLCGDRIHVYLNVADGIVREAAFEGSGCAISTASASMMTDAVKGKTLDEIEEMFGTFHDVITGKTDPGDAQDKLGKLMVFAGVREFPIRVKCATLAWHTLRAAMKESAEAVTTE